MTDYLFLVGVILMLTVVIPGAMLATDAAYLKLKGAHRGQR